jgi:ferredoxin
MVTIDQGKCIGCSACTSICGDVFEMKGDKAQVKAGQEKTSNEQVKAAIAGCPVSAISE